MREEREKKKAKKTGPAQGDDRDDCILQRFSDTYQPMTQNGT